MNLGARRAVVAIVLGSFLAIGSVSAPVGAAESDPKWRTGGDSRACSAPISFDTVGPSGPGVGRRVVVIGDSLTRNSRTILRKSLRKSGWNPTIRCFGGKRLDWGMSQIRDQRKWKGLPKTVVMALGVNDMRWMKSPPQKHELSRFWTNWARSVPCYGSIFTETMVTDSVNRSSRGLTRHSTRLLQVGLTCMYCRGHRMQKRRISGQQTRSTTTTRVEFCERNLLSPT